MKEILIKFGVKIDSWLNNIEKIITTKGIPHITGIFLIDVIIKRVCKWVPTIIMMLYVLSLVSWVISLFIFFGCVKTTWIIILVLILSIPSYLTLLILLVYWYEHLIKKYNEYKQIYNEYKQK